MMLRRHRRKGQTKQSDLSPKQQLDDMKVSELKDLAKDKGVEGYSEMKKSELIKALQE